MGVAGSGTPTSSTSSRSVKVYPCFVMVSRITCMRQRQSQLGHSLGGQDPVSTLTLLHLQTIIINIMQYGQMRMPLGKMMTRGQWDAG